MRCDETIEKDDTGERWGDTHYIIMVHEPRAPRPHTKHVITRLSRSRVLTSAPEWEMANKKTVLWSRDPKLSPLIGYITMCVSTSLCSLCEQHCKSLCPHYNGILRHYNYNYWLVILLLSSFTLFTRKCILPRKKKKKIGISILI